MVRLLMILMALGGATHPLLGQRCGRTDTIVIANQGTTFVDVDISGYLNDDLADPGQGLCGVSLYFRHSYVYDMTLAITSPGGQSVQLVGPVDAQSRPPTALTRWFIDFNTCAEGAQPDFGAPGVWNNQSPFNWASFGTYSGSYLPVAGGCLEDLDTGPVNGTWTFEFFNDRFAETGAVTYLLLEFCDDTNQEGPCCFADAGTLLPIPGLEFCEETPSIPLGLAPRYSQPRPDASEYDYTFAFFRDGALVTTQDNVNLGGLPAGDYEICGLSYRQGELNQLPTDGSVTLDGLRDDLESVDPSLCADLTPVCQTVRLYPIPEPNELDVQLCTGDFFRVGDTDYYTSGTRTITLPGRAGCDSVVVLNLTVVDNLRANATATICAEGQFVQGGNVYDQPGTYVDTLASSFGCDSIVTLELLVAEPITFSGEAVICLGESYRIGNDEFTQSGIYTRTVPAANGCDSTVTIELQVLNPRIVFADAQTDLDCENASVTLDATGSTLFVTNGFGRGVWTDEDGNDLSFAPTLTVTSGGTYFYELINELNGYSCVVRDSIVVRDLRYTVGASLALTQVQCDAAGVPCDVISCRNPVIGILATPDSLGPSYEYAWTAPPGGGIIGPANQREVRVAAPGTYRLTIRDALSGCRFDTSQTIGIDTLAPVASVSGIALLNCVTDSVILRADVDQPFRDRLDVVWTGTNLPGPVTADSLVVTSPGTMTLTVTNRINGCARDTTFTVRRDLALSQISLAPAFAPITCYEPVRELDASQSFSANGQEFYWVNLATGDTVSNDRVFATSVPGDYSLTAVDSFSRCSDLALTSVGADTLRPVADSGPDTLVVNCYTPEHLLGERSTSVGPQYRYSWTTVAEPLDTLSDLIEFFVAEPGGFFRFSVQDATNGCVSTDQTRVLVALDTPRIRIDPVLDFDCFIDSVALDARATNLNYDNQQQWSGPCLAPGVDTNLTYAYCPGQYFYSVINQETGCTSRDSVEILLADNSVVAFLPDTAFLDCETGETRLDRSLGTNAPVVRWFRNGEPVPLVGQRPTVDLPGVYTLVLGNFNESCLDTASIVVTARCPALAIVVPPDSITCINSLVTIDATVSFPAPGPNVETEWLIPPGATTQAGETERQLVTFTPGRFGFVVRNLISGDADTTYVDVARNLVRPTIAVSPQDTISCYQPRVTLSGAGSSQGALFDYAWSTASGVVISDSLTAEVQSGGIYIFEVTQRETGCRSTRNVRVVNDLFVPELSFSSLDLPCDTIDFAIATFPATEGNYTYDWRGPFILGGAQNDTVRVAEAGSYAVEVTNVDNGCAVAEAVPVVRLPCPPFPRLQDTSLSCLQDSITLAATFRDPCQGCSYTWRYNGAVIEGANDTLVRVAGTGTYQIVVINQFGLSATATSVVSDGRTIPANNAGADRTLTCAVTDVLLWNPDPEPDFPIRYQWFGPGGDTIVGATADSLRVSVGGAYVLRSTNTFSTCVAIDTVVVHYDTLAPQADAGGDRLLDCDNKIRVLDGTGSSLGSRYRYAWSGGPSVACLEGADLLNPQVRCGGDYQLRVSDVVNGCSTVTTVTVEVDEALPVVIPLPDTSINCANDRILLTGEDISRPNIAFGWQLVDPAGNVDLPAVAPGTLEVTAAGEYRFFILDTLNGCFNDFTVDVSQDLDVPLVTTSAADTFFCELDSLIISATVSTESGRGTELEWRSATGFFVGNRTELQATIFQPDVYYFTATDPVNFCSATDSVVIARDVEAPVVDAGGDTSLTCVLREVRLNGSATTVSGAVDFQWSTQDGDIVAGGRTATPLINGTGIYLLTATDPASGCDGADLVEVTEDTLRPEVVIIANQGLRLDCNRRELLLDGQRLDSRGQVTFNWVVPDDVTAQPQTRPDDLPVIADGTYRLVLTDDFNGCRDTAVVRVTEDFTPPSPMILPPPPLTCREDSVLISLDPASLSPNYQYRWLDGADSLLGQGVAQYVFAEGEYDLITQSTRNGCRDTTFTVVGADRVPPVVRLAEPPILNCFRSVATVDGTGSSLGDNFTPRWESPGGTGVVLEDPYQINGTEPGVYRLAVTNERNGCVASATVELLRDAIQIADFSFEVDQPACERDRDGALAVTQVSGGQPPFSYQLDNGLVTEREVYEGLPVGEYVFRVIGSDGCSLEKDFAVLRGPEPIVQLRRDTTIRLGDSVDLNFITSFTNYDTLIWTSSGPLPAGPLDSVIRVSPLESQTYRLLVQDSEGCFATDNVVVTVDGNLDVYVPTAFSPNNDATNDLFRAYAGSQVTDFLSFRVYDRWGELLYDLAADPLRGTDGWGWDGRLRGKLMNPQNLVWEMEVRLVDGSEMRAFGSFVLMR